MTIFKQLKYGRAVNDETETHNEHSNMNQNIKSSACNITWQLRNMPKLVVTPGLIEKKRSKKELKCKNKTNIWIVLWKQMIPSMELLNQAAKKRWAQARDRNKDCFITVLLQISAPSVLLFSCAFLYHDHIWGLKSSFLPPTNSKVEVFSSFRFKDNTEVSKQGNSNSLLFLFQF